MPDWLDPSAKVRKNRARDTPLKGNFIGKILNFDSFGAINQL